tara:strand:+ start:3133 stop:3519 length:387 start_codon:yes stop_codon:yes gene_type:complete
MKITIDTTKDSHTEIKKVVKLLNHLVGEEEIVSNSLDMFSSDEAPSEASSGVSQESPVKPDDGSTDDGDSSGLFNMFGESETVKADEGEELPEIKEDDTEEVPEIAEDVDEDSEAPEEKVDVEIVPYD